MLLLLIMGAGKGHMNRVQNQSTNYLPLPSEEKREQIYARIIEHIHAANMNPDTGERFLGGFWIEAVHTPDGWANILDHLDIQINALCPDYHVHQAKEKFGGLRYYIGNVPENKRDEVDKLIRKAETISYKTCQDCGQPGRGGESGGWLATLCDKHGAQTKGWQPHKSHNKN